VQIVIRDHHSEAFSRYLLLRARSGNAPWPQLLEQLGFCPADLGEISNLITTRREQMIRAEYEYAVQRYGITDGSPSYVWESERVPDLKLIPAFKGVETVSVETCSH